MRYVDMKESLYELQLYKKYIKKIGDHFLTLYCDLYRLLTF